MDTLGPPFDHLTALLNEVRRASPLANCQRLDFSIAVVAVPGVHTQGVIDRLVECGVRAILNYAPTTPQVPPDVNIRNIDPVLSLQSMTFYLAN